MCLRASASFVSPFSGNIQTAYGAPRHTGESLNIFIQRFSVPSAFDAQFMRKIQNQRKILPCHCRHCRHRPRHCWRLMLVVASVDKRATNEGKRIEYFLKFQWNGIQLHSMQSQSMCGGSYVYANASLLITLLRMFLSCRCFMRACAVLCVASCLIQIRFDVVIAKLFDSNDFAQ